jgi:uncharacterized membrane protein YkvA (DUF1232 family)
MNDPTNPTACRSRRPLRDRLRGWAGRVRREVDFLTLAARDPRVPWCAKAVAAAAVAYAFSPIDLIPDFVPVIGLVDDLLLVPLGLYLAIRLIPPPLRAELRQAAATGQGRPPPSRVGAAAVVLVWLVAAVLLGWWVATQ